MSVIHVSSPDNTDISRTLYGKISEIIDKADVNLQLIFHRVNIFHLLMLLLFLLILVTMVSVAIETLTRGTINEIIVDAGGTGYAVGDKFVVDNCYGW